ncbi:MAG: L,D-transpeptidase family protein [Thermodesulfobacteriota bacterium]
MAKKQDLGQLKPDQRNGVSVNPVSNALRNQILNSKGPIIVMVGETTTQLSDQVPKFYELQNFQPVWTNNSTVLPQANSFIKIIKEAENEGLEPSDYHLKGINVYLNEIQKGKDSVDPHMLAQFDLLLTDAFILYVSHLINGRIEPQGVDLTWLKNHSNVDFGKIMDLSLGSNQFQNVISNYENPLYIRLRTALLKYKIIQANGGWPLIPSGPKVEKGQRGERIKILRERLTISGDLNAESTVNSDIYDENVASAVRKFQRRHGLADDGIVGPNTLAELNVPVEKRIEQITINMERYRWMPRNIGSRYIAVNIPSFHLDVIQEGKTVLTMPVVVGKPYWNTPLFSADMRYIILNPYWNIPRSIALEETLPKIHADPEYLSKRNIRVLRGWTDGSTEIDPSTIDWSQVNNNNLKYRFRQNPGPSNPLGRVKFMLPNNYNVYLHDTSQKNLFKKQRRDLSHGCIRVENPLGLAEYVLSTEPGWTKERIESEIRKGKSQSIILPDPIPVYLVYFTAWVDDHGDVHFRHDVYGRDEALYQALRKTS